MAESAQFPGLAISRSAILAAPRHSVLVRITHWIATLCVFALLVSGIAILLAHPRLYWGETGGVGAPSLFDLPLPFVLVGQTGWARYLHFLSAWVCVLTGTIYVLSSLLTAHFRRHLLPGKADLSGHNLMRVITNHLRLRPSKDETDEGLQRYNVLQRLTYLAVIFILFPLVLWSGLAMSPAVTSVFPALVTVLGGQQSARTIHFFAACALVIFLIVHIAMVSLSGFRERMRSMIAGRTGALRERA